MQFNKKTIMNYERINKKVLQNTKNNDIMNNVIGNTVKKEQYLPKTTGISILDNPFLLANNKTLLHLTLTMILPFPTIRNMILM